jgi:hypothetical protein
MSVRNRGILKTNGQRLNKTVEIGDKGTIDTIEE